MKPVKYIIKNIDIPVRLIILATRGLMMLAFGSILSSDELGRFSLVAGVVSYSLIFFGFDLYTYTTRQIPNSTTEHKKALITGHLKIIAISYIILCPLLAIILNYLNYSINISLTLGIVVAEHINQEFYRFFIADGRIKLSASLLFTRTAAWVWVCLVYLYFSHDSSHELLLWLWITFSTAAALYSLRITITTIDDIKNNIKNNEALRKIARNSITTIPFWISSLCYKGLSTFDKFVLAKISGIDQIGAYTIAMTVAGTALSLYEPIRLDRTFSTCSKLYNSGMKIQFRTWLKSEISTVFTTSMVLFFLIPVTLVFIEHIGNKNPNFNFEWELILGATLFSITSLLHIVSNQILYIYQKDRQLILSNVIGFLVFALITSSALIANEKVLVYLAPGISMLTLAFFKFHFARHKKE